MSSTPSTDTSSAPRSAGGYRADAGTTWGAGDPFSSLDVTDLAPGSVDVDVLCPGYRTTRIDGVEIVDGDPARLEVPLTPLTR